MQIITENSNQENILTLWRDLGPGMTLDAAFQPDVAGFLLFIIPFDPNLKAGQKIWAERQEQVMVQFHKAISRLFGAAPDLCEIEQPLTRWKVGQPLPGPVAYHHFSQRLGEGSKQRQKLDKRWHDQLKLQRKDRFPILALPFDEQDLDTSLIVGLEDLEEAAPGTVRDSIFQYLAFRREFWQQCQALWQQKQVIPIPYEHIWLQPCFGFAGPWKDWVQQGPVFHGLQPGHCDPKSWIDPDVDIDDDRDREYRALLLPALSYRTALEFLQQADDFLRPLNAIDARDMVLRAGDTLLDQLEMEQDARFSHARAFLTCHLRWFWEQQEIEELKLHYQEPMARASLLARRNDPSLFHSLFMISDWPSGSPEPTFAMLGRLIPENAGKVRLSPAIKRPEYIGLSKSEQKKLGLSDEATFISMEDLLTESSPGEERTDAWFINGFAMQGLRKAMIRDLTGFALSMPEAFSCPSFLADGFVTLGLDEWHDIAKRRGLDLREDGSSVKLDLRFSQTNIGARMWGTNLWRDLSAVVPASNRVRKLEFGLPRDEQSQRATYQCLAISHHLEVVSGVRYELKDSESLGDRMRYLIELLQDGMERGDDSFQAFTDAIEFTPRPFFEVNGQEIDPAEWVEAKALKTGFYKLPSGLLLPKEQYEKALAAYDLRQKAFQKVRLLKLKDLWRLHHSGRNSTSNLGAFNIVSYMEQLQIRIDPKFAAMHEKLQSYYEQKMANATDPLFTQILRAYQRQGVSWLLANSSMGLGVCLADEMGLGKTVQALAYIKLKINAGERVLLLVPKTLLINWQREVNRFAPEISLTRWEGGDLDHDAMITMTTWDLVRRNIDLFAKTSWDLVVIDEAHGFKNAFSQRSRAIRQLEAKAKLALTGTPVENNALELWSIIDWLNPGYLGTHSHFQTYTRLARSSQEKQAMLKPVHEVLRPLLLRRTKNDKNVRLNLPEKVIEEHYYELTSEQAILYRGILEAVYTSIDPKSLGGITQFALRGVYLKAILCIKQLLNHPKAFLGPDQENDHEDLQISSAALSEQIDKKLKQLVKKHVVHDQLKQSNPWRHLVDASGKLSAFVDLMSNLSQESGGILIFTQYRGTAALLQTCLAGMGVERWQKVGFLHGGLTERQRMRLVDDFQMEAERQKRRQREGCPILILSLKAGGLGLNLTGATRVIHYDRWWNPAVEAQATDRAHRFGQDQTVFVHHFVGANTLEESISQMLAEKLELADDLLGQAATESRTADLTHNEGFLNLVDPKRAFRQ